MQRITTLSVAMIVGVAALTLPTPSHAGGYVIDSDGRWVRYPHKYYVSTQPPVVVAPPPQIVVTPPAVVFDPSPGPPSVITLRDPYQTGGVVIAGAGFGGLLLRAGDSTSLVPTYRMHLGLAMGQSEVAARLNLVPHGLQLENGDDLYLYAARLTFEHRFLKNAVIHPVAGLGLEALLGDVPGRDAAFALAATARAGLEFAFPLRHSALAVGLDATGHLPIAKAESFPTDLSMMLSFGAYLDFRF